ncbi:MAG: DUF2330 domain-containing protein [Polyangiaceae bacterium]
MRAKVLSVSLLLGLAGLSIAHDSRAFCGFYVSGADAKLVNPATEVVLMREGTRTVLSMANTYQGPPQDFAMVVPVPVVLQKEQVKTLSPELLARVDQMGSPRLVEYWEQDPCNPNYGEPTTGVGQGFGMGHGRLGGSHREKGVTIEAQFEVGEYEVVILSATDSTALDKWLRDNKYKIPEGAEPYLRPYVAEGSKFFVAKVNIAKVKMVDGRAVLSPLRFHYDSEKFTLPIRLGLINAGEAQDLIVNILSKKTRYEVSNYPNVVIPTNLDVSDATRKSFGSFYAALFDETLKQKPGAAVTEYAWDAGTCDPCPGPVVTQQDVLTLGGDVTSKNKSEEADNIRAPARGVVLTRLHMRYSKEALGEDLVFKEAPPILGGREFHDEKGGLEQGALLSSRNNFQARYIIRHPWTGPIECKEPVRGRWGGPPESAGPVKKAEGARDLAFVPRGTPLNTFLTGAFPPVGGPSDKAQFGAPPVIPTTTAPATSASAAPPAASSAAPPTTGAPAAGGCGCETTAPTGTFPSAVAAALIGILGLRRRRKA